MQEHQDWMSRAIAQAKIAAKQGEVPVGAVLVLNGELIAEAHNEVEKSNDPSAHAELLAIRRGASRLGNWRLEGASLYVTLEPCTMCIGVIINARIKNLYFGAYDSKQGAVGSAYDLSNHPALPHSLEVYPELMAVESAELLKNFFSKCRQST